jgi:DNA-binding NarL/FixJ family response regulator
MAPHSEPITVVVVAESADVRDRLVAFVAGLPGVEVVGHAASAHEVVEAVRILHPRAMIVDVSLPGSEGPDLLRRIKEVDPASILIALINQTDCRFRTACLDAGAKILLDKSLLIG